MNPWTELLKKNTLKKSEQAVVTRFEKAPDSRAFLPLADLLKAHECRDEAVELLLQGVERHPAFTVARVVLARELYERGMIRNAWSVLLAAREPLFGNVLAQRLRFKICLVMGKETQTRETWSYMQDRHMLDEECSKWGDMLRSTAFDRVRERFITESRRSGIPIEEEPGETSEPVFRQPEEKDEKPTAAISALSDEVRQKLSGYHVIPINEIFPLAAQKENPADLESRELDSTTLAGIYEKQGHYQKALNIYRRLLEHSPHSEFLQRKVVEVGALKQEQRQLDASVDPGAVAGMESLEDLDQRIRFLNQLLERLDRGREVKSE